MEAQILTIVPPHKTPCREVVAEDFENVKALVEAMQLAVNENKHCVALAHSQIDDKEPLRLFVTRDKCFINPVIIRHSNYCTESLEGCMTFPYKEAITKKRWNKIEFEYRNLTPEGLSEIQTASLSGFSAWVVQHEVDHLNSRYCYDDLPSMCINCGHPLPEGASACDDQCEAKIIN